MRAALNEGKRLDWTNEALEQHPVNGDPKGSGEQNSEENAPSGARIKVFEGFDRIDWAGLARPIGDFIVRERLIDGLNDHAARMSKARASHSRCRRIACLNSCSEKRPKFTKGARPAIEPG